MVEKKEEKKTTKEKLNLKFFCSKKSLIKDKLLCISKLEKGKQKLMLSSYLMIFRVENTFFKSQALIKISERLEHSKNNLISSLKLLKKNDLIKQLLLIDSYFQLSLKPI